MNAAQISLQKARDFASALRTSRHHGRGWTDHTDRDLAREAQELYLLSQATAPRIH